MRRNFVKNLAIGAASLAGLTAGGQVASAKTNEAAKAPTEQYKATAEAKADKKKVGINNLTGGLSMLGLSRQPGLSPKEYGLRYGNGGSKRSNKLRYAHNAKVKRRNNC